MKHTHRLLIAAFVAILLAEPVVHAIADLSRGDRPEVLTLFGAAPTEDHLRAFERALEDTSPLLQAVRPRLQALRLWLLRDAGEKTVVGREGWMYYKPGVQYLIQPLPDSPRAEALEAILDFQAQLRARGVELLVAPAPDKASVYPQFLREGLRMRDVPAHGRAFLQTLRDHGVEVVDLFAHFDAVQPGGGEALYLLRDTHWTPAGVQAAVEAVAARLRAVPGLPLDTQPYHVEAVETARTGDLLRMIQAPAVLAWFPPETVMALQVRDGDGDRFAPWPEAPVLVLGDSFLRMYEMDEPGGAGFTANLAHALGMPVAAIINDGGAANLVREELARRPSLLEGKRVVVWEFAERDLRLAQGGWRKIALR